MQAIQPSQTSKIPNVIKLITLYRKAEPQLVWQHIRLLRKLSEARENVTESGSIFTRLNEFPEKSIITCLKLQFYVIHNWLTPLMPSAKFHLKQSEKFYPARMPRQETPEDADAKEADTAEIRNAIGHISTRMVNVRRMVNRAGANREKNLKPALRGLINMLEELYSRV